MEPRPPTPQSVTATIQDTVHFFDIGVGQRGLRALLLTVCAGALLLFYAGNLALMGVNMGGSQFRGLNQREAMDQAQLGRNLVRGEGYTTRFIRPMSIWRLNERSRWRDPMLKNHPDLANPPLYPALVGGLLYLVQKGDMAAPDASPPKPDAPVTTSQVVKRVVSWGLWKWVWGGGVLAWVSWLVSRAWRLRLKRGEVAWHGTGIAVCLVLFGLSWTPKTAFEVGPLEAFTVYGPDMWIVYGLGVPLTLANGWLTYLIARRLFDRGVGVMAACLFVLSDTICQYAISGLNVMLLMLWAGLMWQCLVVAQDLRVQERRPVVAVLLGLLAAFFVALAFLTKYAAGWLLLPLCILGWRMWGWSRGRWMALGMAVVFLAVVSPWILRNVWVNSNLLGTAQYTYQLQTSPLRGDTLERQLSPNLNAVAMRHLWHKAAANAQSLCADGGWVFGSTLAAALCVTALLYKFRRLQVNRFKWAMFWSGVVLFIVTCVAGMDARPDGSLAQAGNLLVLLAPLVTMYGTAMFFVLLDRLQLHAALWRTCVIVVVVLLAALPLMMRLFGPAPDKYAYPPYYPPKIAQAAGYLTPTEFMVSDQPWAVAWYGDRRCIWITEKPEEFYKINDLYQHISAFMLTPITLNRRFLSEVMLGEWVDWSPIIRFLNFPKDFPLKEGTRLEGVNMVLVADRKRWPEEASPPARGERR
ncbi:MAG: glycosyltransferase family 39 protein [Verrucomicrobia bacterium]|nr:glycosyltransferase family 39 protein [Verrucomicrobiota bacterium]